MKNDFTKNMNQNSGKSLDGFFSAFSGQKVNLPLKDVETIINNYSAYKSAGFFSKIAGALGYRAIIGITAFALLLTSSIVYLSLIKSGDVKSNFSHTNSAKQIIGTNNPIEKSNLNITQNIKKRLPHKNQLADISKNSHSIISDDFGIEKSENITNSNENQSNLLSLNDDISNHSIAQNFSPVFNSPYQIEQPEFEPNVEPDDIKTLFGDYIKKNSIWFAISAKGASVNNTVGYFNGGKAGWTVNKNQTVGLFGYSIDQNMKTKVFSSTNNLDSGNLQIMYGGIFLEYTFFPDNTVNYFVNLSFGGGGYGVHNDKSFSSVRPFAVLEPGFGIGFNLSKHFKFAIESQYRLASELKFSDKYQKSNFNNILSNNFSLSMMLKIGIF